jgi:hypothetical protein
MVAPRAAKVGCWIVTIDGDEGRPIILAGRRVLWLADTLVLVVEWERQARLFGCRY